MARVFISYTRRDSAVALWLAQLLKSHGLQPWIDLWEIAVGDSIVNRINEGLGASDFLVVLLSVASVQSRWVKEEVGAALMSTIEQAGAKVLPVLLEPCELPPLIKARKYADISSPELRHAGLRDLFGVLGVSTNVPKTVLFQDEVQVLNVLRGKPDIAWTPERVAHRLASQHDPKKGPLADVATALASLRQQGLIVIAPNGRLQVTDQAIAYFRESGRG